MLLRQHYGRAVGRARPGFEPGTSRTLSENHTPRPTSPVFSVVRTLEKLLEALPVPGPRTVTLLAFAARGFTSCCSMRLELLGSLFMTNKPFAFY